MKTRSRFWTAAVMAASLLALAACESAEDRAQAFYDRGMELLAEGEPGKAKLEFRNTLRLQENNVPARYEYARILQDEKDLRGAVRQYQSIIEIDPDHLLSRLALTEIFLIAGKEQTLREADKHIKAALKIEPENTRVIALNATVEYKLGNVELALELARGVLEREPENVTARLVLAARNLDSGEREKALAQVDTGLGFAPENLSLNVIKLGLLENLGDLDGVGAQLKRMVEFYPTTGKFRQILAKWYDANGDKEGAERELRALAALNPDDYKGPIQVARYLGRVHGPEAARAELMALVNGPGNRVEYELALASLDYNQGAKDKAEKRLKAMIARDGDSPDADKARIELSRLQLRDDRAESAYALVDRVLENDPKNVAALTLRGGKLIDEDKPEEAIRTLRTALDAAPNNTAILMKLAQAHERNGSKELAAERLAQATRASRYDPAITLRYAQSLMGSGKTDIAENLLMEAISRNPNNRQLLIGLSGIRLEKKQYVSALQIAEQLQKINPEDEVAARIRAAAYVGQSRFDDSIKVLSDAAARGDNQNSETMISLVRAYLAAGEVKEAKAYLEDLIEKEPTNATAIILLGSVLASQGSDDAAEAAFQSVLEMDPANAAAYSNLARLYSGAGRMEEADAAIRKGLELSADDNMELRLSLAMRLEQERRYDEAIAEYEKLYAEQPGSVVIANNLASLLSDYGAGDSKMLKRAYNIAKRFRDSDQPYLQDTYGWILHLRGEDERAVIPLKAAADALNTNMLVQYHAGIVYAELGQTRQARAHLQRSLELSEVGGFAKREEVEAALAKLDAEEAARKAEAKSAGE